ncbi:hypothetical protein ROZALSC1DRAFT_21074 [Rozella allomycis CSF55]|uniref:Uncharacterized protein n=1 Tax=Rozella allomycis (strain CSF55) TaxID=988480 RepID=A0A4P9YM96_ROZAC|nr:hypothetical protein ROZALSC1DRAFT_21074 [Rozella allomycis CSF55]
MQNNSYNGKLSRAEQEYLEERLLRRSKSRPNSTMTFASDTLLRSDLDSIIMSSSYESLSKKHIPLPDERQKETKLTKDLECETKVHSNYELKIKNLELLLKNAQSTINAQSDTIESLTRDMKKTTYEVDQKFPLNTSVLEKTIEELKTRIKKLERIIVTKDQSVSSLTCSLETQMTNLRSFQIECMKLQNDVKIEKEENAQRQREIISLKKSLRDFEKLKLEFSSNLAKNNEKIVELTEQNLILKERLAKNHELFSIEQKKLQDKASEVDIALDNERTRVQKLKDEKISLENKLISLEEENKDLNQMEIPNFSVSETDIPKAVHEMTQSELIKYRNSLEEDLINSYSKFREIEELNQNILSQKETVLKIIDSRLYK